ncbi:hypothetical protein [Methanobacterium formicicum]|uniref:hypothetical protein n=1 Tax=Methanobacterium formicicum TaxID=2162 RepID=UPI00249196FE|nr:hypothetical protein [Methanobacterium formicicum]
MTIGAVCNGNPEIQIWPHPCLNCGPITYLGVFIPTVTVAIADYYSSFYQCRNPGCDPIIETHDHGDRGVYYDFVDYGAYWSAEDKYYYTPNNPRL